MRCRKDVYCTCAIRFNSHKKVFTPAKTYKIPHPIYRSRVKNPFIFSINHTYIFTLISSKPQIILAFSLKQHHRLRMRWDWVLILHGKLINHFEGGKVKILILLPLPPPSFGCVTLLMTLLTSLYALKYLHHNAYHQYYHKLLELDWFHS